jgi:tripartite-type tricarboxylate transporter receptor subunit TctC
MKKPFIGSALTRRRFIQAGAAGLAAPLFIRDAYAAWPERPVKILVPFGTGGPVDVLARQLQPLLAEELGGATIFIENRAGAAGTIGVGLAARSDPDGYTVLLTSNTIVINPLLYKSVPYDLERDFEPLVDLAGSPTAFSVNPKSGINSVEEFVARAKATKGGLTYGSAGFATPAHLAGEFFKNRAGIEMTHVPFNGAGPAYAALLAAQVDMVSFALPGAHPHIVAGTLTGIAITGAKRWFDLPNVPTMIEAGYPGFLLDTYVMCLVPAKTPPEISEKLVTALKKVLTKEEVKARLRASGLEPTAGGPAELKARIAKELPLWREVVKVAGITPR